MTYTLTLVIDIFLLADIVGGIVIAFLLLLFFRARWLRKKRYEFVIQTGRYVEDLVAHNLAFVEGFDLAKTLSNLPPFNKMLFRFWVWDLRKLVYSKSLYDKVYNFDELII